MRSCVFAGDACVFAGDALKKGASRPERGPLNAADTGLFFFLYFLPV